MSAMLNRNQLKLIYPISFIETNDYYLMKSILGCQTYHEIFLFLMKSGLNVVIHISAMKFTDLICNEFKKNEKNYFFSKLHSSSLILKI